MVERRSSAKPGPPLADAIVIRGRFPRAEMMHDAIERLMMSGFDRADLSVPNSPSPSAAVAADSGARPADTDADARQARTLHTSGAAAATALAAAGITIGTGGAAAPAVTAAVVAGAAAGGAAHAATRAADDAEQQRREADAAHGALILSVRALEPTRQSDAETILQAAGATAIEAVRHASR